jgi:sn-glycerol 3-phosphate transport system permease protein
MNRRPRILPYLLILPTLAFVACFTLLPLGNSLVGSLFKQKLNIPKFHDPVFTGLGNFTALFGDEAFRLALANTAWYVLVTVPASLVLALGLALLLSGSFRGQTAFRLVVFHPAILPMVSAATLWLFFLTPGYGILNQILRLFGYAGPENWTGNPGLALPALMLVGIWKQTGFYMLFLLAGLQGIDRSVMDAARIDGACGPRLLGLVILPLIRRSVLFTSTMAFISAFQTADHVFVMTAGGPSDSSNILLYLLWQRRFEQMDIGGAQAITVLLVAVLLVFTISNFLVSERHEA